MDTATKFIFSLGMILLVSGSGCSSFNRDWRKAAKVQPSGVEGRWEGTWLSHANGHNDTLRCLLTPIAENTYEARFHAKYRKIFSFSYTATFTGRTTNDVFYFSGEADLGRLAGGVYNYEGQVNPTNFFSTYKSKYDHGIFQMERPD